jgi:hypothetical protein
LRSRRKALICRRQEQMKIFQKVFANSVFYDIVIKTDEAQEGFTMNRFDVAVQGFDFSFGHSFFGFGFFGLNKTTKHVQDV